MKLKITVHGVAYEVDVEVLDAGEGFPQSSRPRSRNGARPSAAVSAPAVKPPSGPAPAAGDGGGVTSPIAGTVVEIKCKVGEAVGKDQILLVVEAMKMKTSIAAPTAGKVKAVSVAVGDSIRENQTVVEFE